MFSKGGKFVTNGGYSVPFTIPSGYRFVGVTQIVTRGWIGSAYGYRIDNHIDVWVSNGSADDGYLDVYILFAKS